MRKKIFFLLIITIVIILGWTLWLGNESSEKITVPENWTFFQNKIYKYKIAYPKSWPVYTKSDEMVALGQAPFEPSAGAIFITVYPNKDILYLDEFKQGYLEGCTDKETPLIANLRTWKLVCIESFAGQETNEYFFERGPDLYHISYINGQSELNEIFKKMIRTFDFE